LGTRRTPGVSLSPTGAKACFAYQSSSPRRSFSTHSYAADADGAGSTFESPVLAKWTHADAQTAGISREIEGRIDFIGWSLENGNAQAQMLNYASFGPVD
jgi:hypothetical protein